MCCDIPVTISGLCFTNSLTKVKSTVAILVSATTGAASEKVFLRTNQSGPVIVMEDRVASHLQIAVIRNDSADGASIYTFCPSAVLCDARAVLRHCTIAKPACRYAHTSKQLGLLRTSCRCFIIILISRFFAHLNRDRFDAFQATSSGIDALTATVHGS